MTQPTLTFQMRTLAAAALLTGLQLLAGCATNPATGGTDIVLMSESREIKMGREAHEKLMEQGAAYPDKELQDYVSRIGQNLAKTSDRPDIDYTFTVINDENINAFALPGGFIYINRGLMAYLDSEPELAAVLSHEIGHVTARHSVRQQTANSANSLLAQLAYVTTGSGDLAQASNMYGTSLVRGYGREHELEADGEGAEYLHNAGYDPNTLLDVIGVLKDQEQYNKVRAQAAGRRPQTYHGLYATHPRNDRRLQTVVRKANELEYREPRYIDPTEYRRMTEGLAYGKVSPPAKREEDRFYHQRLGFTFAYPENWTVDRGSRAIVAEADKGDAKLTLTIQRRDPELSSRQFLSDQLNAPTLFQSETLQHEGLEGYTAVAAGGDGKNRRRIAVLYRGKIAYMFEGEVTNDREFTEQDAHFLATVKSFRPMKKDEYEGKKLQYVHWIQAQPGDTFASLARGVRIPDAENQLRLLNGYYPSGEPRVGDWIKIIKDEA
jgi:predicted Zn-dependent protease